MVSALTPNNSEEDYLALLPSSKGRLFWFAGSFEPCAGLLPQSQLHALSPMTLTLSPTLRPGDPAGSVVNCPLLLLTVIWSFWIFVTVKNSSPVAMLKGAMPTRKANMAVKMTSLFIVHNLLSLQIFFPVKNRCIKSGFAIQGLTRIALHISYQNGYITLDITGAAMLCWLDFAVKQLHHVECVN